jgi:hypothetical protein
MSRMTAPAEADMLAASRPALGIAARQLRFVPNVAPTQHLWSELCEVTFGLLRLAPRYESQPHRSHGVRDARVVRVELRGGCGSP